MKPARVREADFGTTSFRSRFSGATGEPVHWPFWETGPRADHAGVLRESSTPAILIRHSDPNRLRMCPVSSDALRPLIASR